MCCGEYEEDWRHWLKWYAPFLLLGLAVWWRG